MWQQVLPLASACDKMAGMAAAQISSSFASTARWMAAARAQESRRPDHLFKDTLAELFAGAEGQAMLEKSQLASGGPNPYLPVRTRYFDNFLQDAVQQHTQVVLLGAGFDTRAYRLPLPSHIHLFELDSAELLREKAQLLAISAAQPRCSRHPVAANLTGDDWARELLAAGFASERSSVWLAEGLFYYLPAPAVAALLRRARTLSAAGSQLLADIFGTGLLGQPALQAYLRWLEQQGLSPPFCHDDPAALLAPCGWAQVQLTLPGSPRANYGRFPAATGQAAAPQGGDPNRSYFVSAYAQADIS
jgi:methyltransferase (TIGR00027 family)